MISTHIIRSISLSEIDLSFGKVRHIITILVKGGIILRCNNHIVVLPTPLTISTQMIIITSQCRNG